MNEEEAARIRLAILQLLNARSASASICPSEAARLLYPSEVWRGKMESIRQVAKHMAEAGELMITQKGEVLEPENMRGPIRLRFKG